ncbi:SRPBCC family protein [Streptomyces sp. NPDC002589]|uniref:SRPBCC family protein n=1 Tax=Streptomyces sp. NPDC002589 TaxID=3154420 RepID=UPI0033339BAF
MDWNRYRFLSLWSLPAPPAAVYAVLERPEDYPRWWPQVRSVTRLDSGTGVLAVRSVLPYTMTFTARETRHDPDAGILEIAMSGDIEGWARWTVTAAGSGTLARYDQVVSVNKPLLRRLAVPARPVLRLNHRLMMAAGRRGLVRYLAAV